MASGVKITDEVKETYQRISMKTAKAQKLKYAVFKFSDDLKKIIVERSATDEEGEDYDTVVSSLPADDVRYLVFDFEYVNQDGTRKSELLLLSWHPESSTIKKKMICASSLNALKASLSVSKNILEGDTLSEVDSKAALEKVGGKSLA